MANPMTPDLPLQLKSVADPALTPGGDRLAFTLSWVEPKTLESRSRIMLLNLDQVMPASAGPPAAAEFTQGGRDGMPRFSPNGQTLAFLRANDEGQRQLWLINTAGGEGRQLTHSPGNIVDFAWAPDSHRLVYCADVDPDAPPPDAVADGLPRVSVARRIRYRYDGLGWRGDAHFHLFIIAVADGSARQITDGDWDDLMPVWSPDGQRIAFVSGRGDERDIRNQSEAYVVAVSRADGAEIEELPEPELWSAGLDSLGALAWSPDGGRLLAAGSANSNGLSLWQSWLYILEPNQPPRCLTDDTIRPCLGIPGISPTPEMRWLPDGRILFLGESRGESYLWQIPLSGPPQRLLGGGMQSSAWSLDSGGMRAALVTNTPQSPADLRLIDLTAPTPEAPPQCRLTRYNDEYLREHPPARQEKFSIRRGDQEIECRLYLPPDFNPSQRYPLVLEIHGGPNGAFYDSFVPLQQLLATNGYLLLAVNPRGSSTYGDAFMTAVLGDWGGEDYLDLMAAVDAVAARPYVDQSRMAVHGYSYGGYMTSWIIGHDTRFKAAVVGAPCIDLVSMYGTSDIGVSFGEAQWGGSMADAFQDLVDRSPLTYAAQVETPVLLLHGEADARCPIAQSEAYLVQLKRLGKTVELVRFPGSSHSFPRQGHPKLREEYLSRTLQWFNHYVG